MTNTKCSGKIDGNALAGLDERFCIEVPRVFDGCVSKYNNVAFAFSVDAIPTDAVAPFTFVNACSNGDATMRDLRTIPLGNGCSRVASDVRIPLIVNFKDSLGKCYSGTASIVIFRDMMLKIPYNSLSPYQIKVAVNFISSIGSFISSDTVSIQACYIIVMKVIVMTDILVPSYGFCVYPECNNLSGDECNQMFENFNSRGSSCSKCNSCT